MHSFRGFKELHLNLKIVPDLFFHCNFINPLIIFETIFGKWIRLPACKARAGLHVSRPLQSERTCQNAAWQLAGKNTADRRKKPQTRVFHISTEERLLRAAEQFHQHFVTIR